MIEPGQDLLHYRLIEKIGEGGMGEVWKALDTTLDREVAIKVLPEAVATDTERLTRFEREAKLLASLNHPNIAAVYGLHESDGVRFIAMELVVGEDLFTRLHRGPLPLDEALSTARRVAQALEAAHDSGVIHRDLKPANIQLVPGGQVKVLDFGLAKALSPFTGSGELNPTMSPTVTSTGTAAGVILGTAAYMSPEQARGHEVDRRADLWAFGCVLFEMLAGRRPFAGGTISDTLASVLKEDPDWQALPTATPPVVRRLLGRCLAKDARKRQSGAADARLAIEEALSGGVEEPLVTADSPAPRAGQPLMPWLLTAVFALLAIVAGWAALHPRGVAPGNETRLSIVLPEEAPLSLWETNLQTLPSIAISPDGTHIVYVAVVTETVEEVLNTQGRVQLFLRAMDDLEPTPLAGTEAATTPVFSPDGRWVLFEQGQTLYKVAITGGAPVELATVQGNSRGAHWGDNDTIVFVPDIAEGVWAVPASGGTPRQVTRPDRERDEISHRFPTLLPGGEHVLFTIKSATLESFDDAEIAVASLATGETRVILEGGMDAHYVPPGQLLYGRDGTVFAVPFDLDRLEVTGTSVPVVDGVVTSPSMGCAQFDVSRDGTLVYVPGETADYDGALTWIDRDGVSSPAPLERGPYSLISVSPDGRQALVMFSRANDDLWLYDIERQSLSPLIAEKGNDGYSAWTRDGKWIGFSNDQLGKYDLYRVPVDGSLPPELLLEDDVPTGACSFTSDAQHLLYVRFDEETQADLWILTLDEERTREPFQVSPHWEDMGVFSPDDRWIAYMSNESGRDEVYVRPYPGPGGKKRISMDGGDTPQWSRDGRELFYEAPGALMSVPLTWEPEFRVGAPRKLFDLEDRVIWGGEGADGRFLITTHGSASVGLTHVGVIRGWRRP